MPGCGQTFPYFVHGPWITGLTLTSRSDSTETVQKIEGLTSANTPKSHPLSAVPGLVIKPKPLRETPLNAGIKPSGQPFYPATPTISTVEGLGTAQNRRRRRSNDSCSAFNFPHWTLPFSKRSRLSPPQFCDAKTQPSALAKVWRNVHPACRFKFQPMSRGMKYV